MYISFEVLYQIVMVVTVLCGAAYKLGYEIGKNAKK